MPAATRSISDEEAAESAMPPDEGGSLDEALTLDQILALPQMQAKIVEAAQAEAMKLREEIKADILASMQPDKPPLVTVPKIGDRFTEANGNGAVLKHYRCDRAQAMKIAEMDMELFEAYSSGVKEVPKDPVTGRPKVISTLCVRKGRWISFIDTHCYVYTENQAKQIEYLRKQPRKKGGMPDIYEDTGAQIVTCYICQPPKQFADATTFAQHMLATHGEAGYAAA